MSLEPLTPPAAAPANRSRYSPTISLYRCPLSFSVPDSMLYDAQYMPVNIMASSVYGPCNAMRVNRSGRFDRSISTCGPLLCFGRPLVLLSSQLTASINWHQVASFRFFQLSRWSKRCRASSFFFCFFLRKDSVINFSWIYNFAIRRKIRTKYHGDWFYNVGETVARRNPLVRIEPLSSTPFIDSIAKSGKTFKRYSWTVCCEFLPPFLRKDTQASVTHDLLLLRYISPVCGIRADLDAI